MYKIGRRALDGALMFTGLQTAFTSFRFGTDGDEERVVIDSSGRVGIGTTSPGSYSANNLVVANTGGGAGITIATSTSDYGRIFFADGTSGNAAYRGVIQYNHSDDSLQFKTADSEAFRIDSSGRLGLGTTSPDDVLDVRSGAAGFSQFVHASGQGGIRIAGTGASSDANLVFSNNHTSGISDEFTIQMNGATDDLLFISGGPGGTERVRITEEGKVGIGTSTPAQALTNASAGTAITLTTGVAPQYRLNGTATDNDDDDRAIFGLATAAANFFNTSAAGDAVLRTTNGGNLLFGEGTTERMRITSDDFVRLASGTGGIQFRGDTAAANALDDYEEGTFVPAIIRETSAPTISYTYRTGSYVKIGRLVLVYFDITISSISGGLGRHSVSNLPFATATDSNSGGYGSPQFRASTAFNLDARLNSTSAFHDTTTIDLLYMNNSGSEVDITVGAGRITGWSVYMTNA